MELLGLVHLRERQGSQEGVENVEILDDLAADQLEHDLEVQVADLFLYSGGEGWGQETDGQLDDQIAEQVQFAGVSDVVEQVGDKGEEDEAEPLTAAVLAMLADPHQSFEDEDGKGHEDAKLVGGYLERVKRMELISGESDYNTWRIFQSEYLYQ